MRKKIRFIINHKAGTSSKQDIPNLVTRHVDPEQYEIEIVFTKAPGHAIELSREAAERDYHVVVSVGGDGSANEVAAGLQKSRTALAFIAMGSGNGMSRHLKIPMNIEHALWVINSGKIEPIDTILVNGKLCLGILGVGFDAHIAHLFANRPKRGFSTYAKLVLSEFYKYKPVTYEFNVDGLAMQQECFLLTFANSSQFGNNARIAPFANVQDGIIEISMIKKFPLVMTPSLIYRLMNNSIHRSKFFSMMQGKNIVLKNKSELHVHIDGEPVTFNNDIHIQIVPHSLNVLVPSN